MPALRLIVLAACLIAPPACGTPAAPSAATGGGRFAVTIPGAGVTIGGVLYRPALLPNEVRPALVVVHGHLPYGTLAVATIENIAKRYSERGYIALAISLRGWPPSGGSDDCALEQPDDVVQVVAWLKGQSGVDAAHVGLMGYSKGGQMVLLTAARGAAVQAVVAYYPPTDLARWKETTSNPDTVAYITQYCEPGAGLAPRSPLGHAAQITAPVLLVHGDADTRVPMEQSELMAAALRAAGREVELLVVPGGDHGFTLPQLEVVYPIVDGFLASRLALK